MCVCDFLWWWIKTSFFSCVLRKHLSDSTSSVEAQTLRGVLRFSIVDLSSSYPRSAPYVSSTHSWYSSRFGFTRDTDPSLLAWIHPWTRVLSALGWHLEGWGKISIIWCSGIENTFFLERWSCVVCFLNILKTSFLVLLSIFFYIC